jgi:predicted secreted protein
VLPIMPLNHVLHRSLVVRMDVTISVERLAIQTTTMATTIVTTTTIREAINNHRVVIHQVEAIPNLFHLRLPHPPIPIMIVKKIKDGIIVVVVAVVVVVENVGADMKMKKTDVELVIVKRTAMDAHAIRLVIEMMIISIVMAVIVIMIENATIAETEMIVDVGNAVEATNAMNEEVDGIEELVRTATNFELGGEYIPIIRVLTVKND